MKGSPLLRIGIVFALVASAVQWFTTPPTLSFLSTLPTFIVGVALCILTIMLLLRVLSRIVPAIVAAYFILAALAMGATTQGGLLLALAFCSASLCLIHEEHIPWRQRKILGRLFGHRH